MEISDEELFNNALEAPEPEVIEQQPEQAAEGDDQRPRDEQGRFAPKQEVEPKPEAEVAAKAVDPVKDEAHVPSWRLKEIREERDSLRQQLAEFQRQIATQKPQSQPAAKPDLFEKPDEFVRANVQEALSPIEQKFSGFIESYSRRDAIRTHGEEKVTEAFGALDRLANAGDPQALAAVQAVKQSMDPFGDIVAWHARNIVAANPDKFFQDRLEAALKDDKFKGELLAKLNPASAEKPKPVFKVPPNLSRAAAEQTAIQEDGDLSNESLFANALR